MNKSNLVLLLLLFIFRCMRCESNHNKRIFFHKGDYLKVLNALLSRADLKSIKIYPLATIIALMPDILMMVIAVHCCFDFKTTTQVW